MIKLDYRVHQPLFVQKISLPKDQKCFLLGVEADEILAFDICPDFNI